MAEKKAIKKDVKKDMFDIIIKPVITEKATVAAENGSILFAVRKDASKTQIKNAIEAIYNVTVENVNTLNNKGKVKRFRGRIGKRADMKKAYVKIKDGEQIDIMNQ
jgi:large subunit ribosomal protein L23